MLKPIVIGQDTWKNQLQDARSLLKQWFPEENDFSQSEKSRSNDSNDNE
jgi:MSHA biogenesis protein MshL